MTDPEPRPKEAARPDIPAKPVTYLITFACYGTHLHGDESGSVDRRHNQPGSRAIDADPGRAALERRLMNQLPYALDELAAKPYWPR